jgi:hypothetical protein
MTRRYRLLLPIVLVTAAASLQAQVTFDRYLRQSGTSELADLLRNSAQSAA